MESHKVSSTIRYSKPGTLPPIYLAGSFSSPEWEPQEMTFTTDEVGGYEFYKEVEVEEGKEYQYKFRVGLGDWWVLNESSPTATDSAGNKNNFLKMPGSSKNEIDNLRNDNAFTPDDTALPTANQPHFQDVEQANDLLESLKSTHTPAVDRSIGDHEEPDNFHTLDSTILPTSSSYAADADIKSAHHTKETPPNSSDAVPAMSQVVEEELTGKININNVEFSQLQGPSSSTLAVQDREVQHANGIDKDAGGTMHEMGNRQTQVQDATFNPLDTRQQSSTPDIAAEVADYAAIIDREQPTPPISDAEAGRIGLRRMSQTPIPEVANTAAEVANTAATLDGEYFHASRDYEGGIGEWHVDLSLPESARNLSIPERNELKREQAGEEKIQNEELLRSPGAKLLASRDQYHARLCKEADAFSRSQETDQIWKDILAAREDAVDEANKRGLRHSDLGDDNRELFGLARITSPLYWCKASQARAFPDGNDPQLEADIAEQEDRLAFYQYRAKIESGELVERQIGSIDESTEFDEDTTNENIRFKDPGSNNDSVESKQGTSVRNTIEPNQPYIKTPIKYLDQKKPSKEFKIQEPNGTESVEHTASKETKAEPPAERTRAQFDDADVKQDESLVEVHESRAELPPEIAGEPLDGTKPDGVRSPVTPSVVGDEQGYQDEGTIREILTNENGHSNAIQPATPALLSGSKDSFRKSVDTANATAIADKGENQLKKRKQQRSPAGDRPLTPTSMRSDGRDAKSKNFLRAFWRVVFVDWIGGLITRLCGSNRHK